jgi:hypothetical protein
VSPSGARKYHSWRPVAVENPRRTHLDVAIGQPIPGADRDLAQPIVDDQSLPGAKMTGDDFSSLPRPAQRAGDDPRECGVRQASDQLPDGMRLGHAALGQRRVEAALNASLQVPLGLAVADQQDAAAHDSGAARRSR